MALDHLLAGVLVFLRLNSDLAAVPLVLVGALAAALGRLTLATGARHLCRFMSPRRVASLAAAQATLAGSRGRVAAGLGLFAIRHRNQALGRS